jgi:diketogulonate reductase-like aldo/keto reductase
MYNILLTNIFFSKLIKLIMKLELNNGKRIPQFGLGMYKMTRKEMDKVLPIYYKICPDNMHFDGASVYENQIDFAQALSKAGIPREKIFLTDKLWDTEHHIVEEACRAALSRLNTNYLDMYLIHWPFSMAPSKKDPLTAVRDSHGHPIALKDITLNKVWAGMERLVDLGLARSIGVSNFNETQISSLLSSCRINPAVLQIESHPWLPQSDLIAFCHANDILVEAYAPLGSGSDLLYDEVIQGVAEELKGTGAQVCMAFARQRGLIALCKTGNPKRLHENLSAVTLSDDQMSKLRLLKNEKRLFCPSEWYDESVIWP